MIGYERVGTTLMDEVLPTQRHNLVWETEDKVRDILVRAGLQEIISRTLTTPEDHEKLNDRSATSAQDSSPYITITNPSAIERRAMRRSLLVSGLENLARNRRFTDRLTIFEIGRSYLPEAGDGILPLEDRRVCIVLSGPRQPDEFYVHDDAAGEMDFFDLKGIVETLLERLGFKASSVRFEARPDTGTYGPRCAEVCLDGHSLGLMGELHPTVRRAFGLPNVRVCAAELRIEPMIKPHWSLEPMKAISNYPPVVEDLAFIVAEEITARQIEDVIATAGGELVVEVKLFDLYRGEPLPADAQVTCLSPDVPKP